MKVLWFTNTPSLYQQNSNAYNGGGWIESLELNIRENPNIELAIAFFHPNQTFKVKKDNVIYYPICEGRNLKKRLQQKFNKKQRVRDQITAFLRIIDDFKPDIIHVFGSERSFGLVARHTSIPIVLHIQGVLNPYLNAWYPPLYSSESIYRFLNYNPWKIYQYAKYSKYILTQAQQELISLSAIKYYMGRTKWDEQVVSILSPNSNYYICNEILRNPFYTDRLWKPHDREEIILTTTISSPLYKGFDLVLKTAELLTTKTGLKFEWRIFGNLDPKISEWKLGIKASEVKVKLCGVIAADTLVDELLNADMFIHPSYIDNSPNSVCEAQMLGLPIISTNVGGISSLIKQEETGVLVPANDLYALAARIIEINTDKKYAVNLGKGARKAALERHNIKSIVNQNISIYQQIITLNQ